MARTLLRGIYVLRDIEGSSIQAAEVNGHPGVLCLDGRQRVLVVLALDIGGGQIRAIRSIVNPDKLRHLGPVSDRLPSPRSPDPGQQ